MIYVFTHYRLDTDRRELYRDDRQIALRPKVFDLLVGLIEQRDRVVAKDELFERVWPGRYISETTLSSCIKELRKALGDTGKEKKLIKTAHGKGFRFIADLQPPAPAPAAVAAQECVAATAAVTEADDATSPPRCERKNLSALRCALVDADALAERLDAETMHHLLQELYAAAQSVVSRFDGQVTQWLSDGFLALFGVPDAHEDHARRALLAAFELVTHGPRLQQQYRATISFGLTSGAAIVSGVPGNPRHYFTTLGSVMRLAETLCFAAGAGRVMLSDDSYRLLRGDVRVRARPLAEEQNAWLVDHIVTRQAGVPRRFRRRLTPLIGRSQELSLLHQRLAQAQEGRGQAVAVVGNPGIGKSRLVGEFLRELDDDVCRLQANCFSHSRGTPYQPLRELLRRCCRIDDNDPDDALRQKLSSRLQTAGLDQPSALALLLELLDQPYDAAPLQSMSARMRRDRIGFYLQRLLLSGGRTRVIVLEDMHWIDASSRSWLTSLIERLAGESALLIVTYRPGVNPDWLALGWGSQLALAPLTQEHCQCLLRSLPRAAALENRLPELARMSAGNPFFLEELALNADDQETAIPVTVQGVLTARIDQLAIAEKQLLQAAAVIGQRGPLRLLAAVTGLSDDDMETSLARLQRAELLFRDYDGERPRFAFRHALVQEVACANQLAEQRRPMHERIAAVLRDDFPKLSAARPELLAHHHGEAGHFQQSARYWQRAGRYAYERYAFVEAIDHVNQGLRVLERLPDPAARAARELELLMTLGSSLVATRGYGAVEVEQTWARAGRLCEQLADHGSLFRVLSGLSNYYWVCGDFERAFVCNRRLLGLARRSANPALRLRAKAATGELLLHRGRLRAAKRYLDDCMRLMALDATPNLATQASAVAATCYAAWLYWHLQQRSLAYRYADQALRRARASGQPFTLSIALCLTSELYRFCERPQRALELADEGVAISGEQNYPFWHGSTLVTLGWAEARRGDAGKGVATIRRGIDVFKATGARVQLTSWLGALADAYRVAGDGAAAAAAIDEASAWAEKTGDRYYLPQLQKLRERLRRRRDVAA